MNRKDVAALCLTCLFVMAASPGEGRQPTRSTARPGIKVPQPVERERRFWDNAPGNPLFTRTSTTYEAPTKEDKSFEEAITRAQIDYGPNSIQALEQIWKAASYYVTAHEWQKARPLLEELEKHDPRKTSDSGPIRFSEVRKALLTANREIERTSDAHQKQYGKAVPVDYSTFGALVKPPPRLGLNGALPKQINDPITVREAEGASAAIGPAGPLGPGGPNAPLGPKGPGGPGAFRVLPPGTYKNQIIKSGRTTTGNGVTNHPVSP
ncbi:MAG: hypothetical protein KC777_18480 [Cyanobacteria bacterium HKST-UBA02]|nr:hypothetical protein [Cyanobacteria bacterium HKST-UBA02]